MAHLIERGELSAAWRSIERDMKPSPEWFDADTRTAIAAMGSDHEQTLKREWQRQQYTLPFDDRQRRWYMKPYHLIGEGIAIGIKIGIEIERRRHAGNDN